MPLTTMEPIDAEGPERPNTVESASRRSLPIAAIAGAVGKTTTGWHIVKLYEQAGFEIGAWLSGGVYVDKEVRQDELHAWELATHAARAKEVDLLVQEIPSVLARNLPGNSVGMAVFTSICGSDDECQRDPATVKDLLALKAVATAVAPGGRIIANADDLMIVDVAVEAERDITYYALNGGNPVLQQHLNHGGDGCWIQNQWVKAQVGGVRQRIIRVDELPGTLRGNLLFQIQNMLAAIAACLPLVEAGVELEPLVKRLSSFDPIHRDGVQLTSENQHTVLTDNPRTLLSVKQIARGVRAFAPKRVILAIGDFDLFTDDDAVEAARVLGSIAGIAILTGNGFSRERLELLKEGLMRSHTPPAIIIKNSIESAIDYVESILSSGDVALVLNDRPAADSHRPRAVTFAAGS